MIRKIAVYIIVVSVLLSVGVLWHYRSEKQQALSPPQHQALVVKAAKATVMSIAQSVTAVGTLRAVQESNIAPEMSGTVIAIDYTPGSYVSKGAVLFRLDDRLYQAQLQSSLAALRLASLSYHRAKEIAHLAAESKQSLDQLRANYLEAKAAVAKNRAYVSQSVIKAPFNGLVSEATVSIGDYVTAGESLATLTNQKLLQVEYRLPEHYVGKLKLQQPVSVVLMNNGKHQQYRGYLSYIAPDVNPMTHSIEVRATIPNAKDQLVPGLFVKVQQVLGKPQASVVVPLNSIVPTISGAKVYVIVHDRAKAINVVTGVTVNGKVQILKGLKPGAVVITAGAALVKNGDLVKVTAS